MPVTERIADYSYCSDVASCERYAYYKYERSLVSGEQSLALTMGKALHIAIDHLYTHAWDVEGAISAALVSWGDFALPVTHRLGYATKGHLETIIRNYSEDRDPAQVTPIRLRPEDLHADARTLAAFEVDDEGFIRLAESPLTIDWDGVPYGGMIDLPNRMGSDYTLWDNKSSRNWISEHWAQKYAYSHQFRGYLGILRHLTGMPFDRVYVNGIYTGKEASDDSSKWGKRTTRRSQLFGPYIYSPSHIAETREWARGWLARAAENRERAARIEAAGGSGENAWLQNDTACFKFGEPCTYYDICKRSPHLREAVIKQLYTIRDFRGALASGADSD